MEHRGEIVAEAIRESGYSITALAEKLGRSRRWMYQAFENPQLSLDMVLEIGKIIHVDFTDRIKSLKSYSEAAGTAVWSEPQKMYETQKVEVEKWKNKYLELLEKYNELLLRLSELETSEKKKSRPNKKK